MADDDGSLKDDLERLVRRILGLPRDRALPRIDYLATYDAEVKAVTSDGSKVDLAPTVAHVKPIAGVEVRVGIPGAVAVVEPGSTMKLGWVGGDPSKPYAEPSWRQGATTVKLVLNASTVILGAEAGAQFVALANKVNSELDAIASAFSTHTHADPVSGVTSGPNATYTAQDVAASNVKAK